MNEVHVLAAGNERGGAASHVVTLARVVLRVGRESDFVFVLVGKGHLYEQLANLDGLQIHVTEGGFSNSLTELRTWFAKVRPKIVHAHGPRMNILAWLSAKKAKVPFTTTIHSNIYKDFLGSRVKSIMFPRLVIHSLKSSVGAFVVNPHFSSLVPNLKTNFVPNGIDLQPLHHGKAHYRSQLRNKLGIPETGLLVGTAARFDPVKDLGTMIRSLSFQGMEEVHLAIAGDGPMRDELQKLSQSLGLHQRVHFLGFISHVREFYAGLDAHLLTSLSEGTPFSILEAGFYGVPNVGSDIPGITHLLVQGKTGLTFTVSKPSELARVLRMLFNDSSLQKTIVENFQTEVLPKYTPIAMLQAYEQGYVEFLEEARNR